MYLLVKTTTMAELFAQNLNALARTDDGLADLLRSTDAHSDLTWCDTKQSNMPSALLECSGADGRTRRLTLASRHRPGDEAERLAATADLDQHATFISLGFGLGYHVAALAERLQDNGLLIIYEPDVSLLRAVLQKIDCTAWIGRPNVVIFTGEPDGAAMTRRLEIKAGLIAQGVQTLIHPPTRQMHGEALSNFAEQFRQFVAYCRTNLATTLVNAATTCRNLVHNVGHYAAGTTIAELEQIATGHPAVLVAAGPSLAQNVHLLTDPAVRDRVVIIAAQTMLKPLLARGIRPHFVTALDYHEISSRFYEDLPAVDDVTLVVEPKANKSILDSYPGPVRICQSRFLDILLGPLARPIPSIQAGSTVAHLSLYLAQFLGCDPIILMGQDLGFTDGLYYCPGTAIHDVWAPELNAFNTLEMMEWRRIVRHKTHLQKQQDIHGRPIYSDEQMMTYLRQFERDFAAAEQTIIDATEGGMPKQHTTVMTLAEALDRHAERPLPDLPAASRRLNDDQLAALDDHLHDRMYQVRQLRQVTQQTLPLLRRMLKDQRQGVKMNKHFAELDRFKRRVEELAETFALVNELNQVGAFNRIRADRSIRVSEDPDEYERQRRQLERDLDNVQWLSEACDEALEMFTEAAERVVQQRRSPADMSATPKPVQAA